MVSLPYPSVLDAIGRTPLVQLSRVVPPGDRVLLLKLEYLNPSGSTKDRFIRYTVERAEAEGRLRPGMCLLEASTGSTGIATAMVGAAKGYPVTIIMPEGMSLERRKIIRALGAQLILTEGGGSDMDRARALAMALAAERPDYYFFLNQFANEDNIRAHQEWTAQEIWDQTQGQVDGFVAAQGTGGTVSGVGRFLKARRPDVRIFTVEPTESPLLTCGLRGPHGIEGIGDGILPDVLDLSVLDGIVRVSTEEAVQMARRLMAEEGILAGVSTGANVAACLKVWRQHPELKVLVSIAADSALRYLSTALFVLETPHHVRVPALACEQLEQIAEARLALIE